MVSPEVRSARAGDAPAIRRVARAAWHAAYDDVLGERAVEQQISEWYDEDAIRKGVTDDAQVFVVAADAGLVGFATAARGSESEAWQLGALYVHPDRWREGIGTALLERVEVCLRDRGVTSYVLAVLASNTSGVAFYESRGFVRYEIEIGELAGVEVTECWYRKRL